MKVFLDTSAFIGLCLPRDQWHRQALDRQRALLDCRAEAFTSDVVIHETLTWLAVRVDANAAQAFGRRAWQEDPALRILGLTRADELASLVVLGKFSTLGLSFADASTIHLVRSRGLDRVFSFDRHFAQAGLALL